MNISITDQPIANLTDEQTLFHYPVEKIWTGKISLQNRIQANQPLGEKVNVVLSAKNLEQYIVTADSSAPTRCIDGRKTNGWTRPKNIQKQALGPKVAGGTAHAALTHRIVDTDSLKKDLRFETDIHYVIDQYKKAGIGFGGHIDDHATGINTGCGAVDNINLILEKIEKPEPREQLRALTSIIMGDAYDGRHVVNEITGRILLLDSLKPLYMPKEDNDPKGEFEYKKVIVDLIRKEAKDQHEPVPQLIGTHNEVAVVVNMVPGTTFDTDRFSDDNDDDIQVFGWDIWEIFSEAERLYPYDMTSSRQDQDKATQDRMAHVTARILLGIATAMVLTDGSLKVVLVQP